MCQLDDTSPTPEERRLALLAISAPLIAVLLRQGAQTPAYTVIAHGLPEDATILGASYQANTVYLLVQSASFAPVEPGTTPPDLPVPQLQTEESTHGH